MRWVFKNTPASSQPSLHAVYGVGCHTRQIDPFRMPGATPCPRICHGARRSSPWRARSGSARAAREGALPLYRLRGIGGARDGAGPLLRARDQARESWPATDARRAGSSRPRPGAQGSWKRASSPTRWIVDALIKKYLSHLPLYRQAADLHEITRSESLAARLMQPS